MEFGYLNNKSQRGFVNTTTIVAVVTVIVLGGILASKIAVRKVEKEPVYCTQDLKQCPDGSYIGRIPPNCEFAACPGEIIGRSGIFGKVLVATQCPGPARSEMEEECVDQPYKGTFIVMTQDRERQVASFQSDSKGEFRVSVPPGEYIITSSDSQPSIFCRAYAQVEPDKFTEVKVRCDTGVR